MIALVTFLAGTALTAATPAAAEPVFTPAEPPEKLTCRRYAEIGSLVKKKRVCHTLADWKRIDSASQRNVEDLQNARNGTRSEALKMEGVGIPINICRPSC